MLIDCDTCHVRGDACSDCVVTALLATERPGPPTSQPVELDEPEYAALGVLAAGGLVPPLRLVTGPRPAREPCREGSTPGQDGARGARAVG